MVANIWRIWHILRVYRSDNSNGRHANTRADLPYCMSKIAVNSKYYSRTAKCAPTNGLQLSLNQLYLYSQKFAEAQAYLIVQGPMQRFTRVVISTSPYQDGDCTLKLHLQAHTRYIRAGMLMTRNGMNGSVSYNYLRFN